MNHPISIENYTFLPEDELFLDANVWLFIFGPQNSRNSRTEIYSSAFRRILEAQSSIYIDVLIVSEFINAYTRILWRQSNSDPNFKRFRNSPQFKPIAEEVVDNIRRVLNHCLRIENQFANLDIESILNEYANGGTDFNDQVFGNLCMSKNLKLVTDDQDFMCYGMSVLTANSNMLV